MQFRNVFKTLNVEGHVSCSFYLNPSQTHAKSLSLDKCSSHRTSSGLVYSRKNEQLLIVLWSHGSAGHPLLLLAFIVSKWIAISSRRKELTFWVLLGYLLVVVLHAVFHCSYHCSVLHWAMGISQNACYQYCCLNWAVFNCMLIYSRVVSMPWSAI